MSRIILKSLATVATASIALLSLFAAPATAQDSYAPNLGEVFPFIFNLNAEDPVVCGGQPFGYISGGVEPYTVVYSSDSSGIAFGPAFTVANQGNYQAPAGTINYAATTDGTYRVMYTVTDSNGNSYTGAFTDTITDNCDGVDPTASVPAAVPVAAAPAAQQQLAFTGNDVSLPVTAGAVLIGAGGLLLLAANKRSRIED